MSRRSIFWPHGGLVATIPANAVYNGLDEVQYIGISRMISASVKLHSFELPEECIYVRCVAVDNSTKSNLQAAWKQLIFEYLASSRKTLPPGNEKGNCKWTKRKRSPEKGSIWLTTEASDNMSTTEVSHLCRQIIKTNTTVAFIKGTR